MSDPIPRTSFADLRTLAENEVRARAPQITDFAPFSEQDAFVSAIALAGEALQEYALDQYRLTRIGGAEDEELDELALDQWGLERVPAAKAQGQLVLARASAAAGAETILLGAEFQSPVDAEGNVQRVVTTAAYSMTGLSLTIDVESAVEGIDGNSAAATFASASGARKTVAFVDATITFTQPGAIAGGAPAQSDESFRSDIRDYVKNRQRATKAAVVVGAKRVGGIFSVAATDDAATPGLFTLYVADRDGRSSEPLLDDVRTELLDWRALGVAANVIGASYLKPGNTIDVTFVFATGVVNTAELVSSAFAAGLEYTNTLAAGQTWYRNMCEGAMREVDKAAILAVSITFPTAASVTPTATQIIHSELGDFKRNP